MSSFKAELLRIDDEGVESDGKPQVLIIDQVTHLGRSRRIHDYCARKTPSALYDAKIVLQVEGDRVSRNHLVMYPSQSETDKWSIVDLNSLNGTLVNGVQLKPGEKVQLERSAVIELANVRFRFRPISRDENINHALLVGNPGNNLRGTRHDIADFRSVIENRGFAGNIEELCDSAATRENIIRGLTRMQRMAACDSLCIFYFSGHCDEEGLLHTSGGPPLTAEDIYGAFSNFRGQILLVLDGCYSSVIGDHHLRPQHVAVIGNEAKSYEQRFPKLRTDPNGKKGDDEFRSCTTRAICEVLAGHEGRIDVRELVRRVQEDPLVKGKQAISLYGDRSGIELVTNRVR